MIVGAGKPPHKDMAVLIFLAVLAVGLVAVLWILNTGIAKPPAQPSDSENVDYDSMFTAEANAYAASGGKDPWPPKGSNLLRGPRGGWYTWETTKDGRSYRRYR